MFQKLFSFALLTIAVWAHAADYGNYKGSGGMAAYAIKPNVYEYHYDKGFTGPDAAGWDPNLQFAWSRIAAASACSVPVAPDKLLPLLISKYGQDNLVHKMVGIDFHVAQIRANKAFCTEERLAELRELMPQFERGEFPTKF